MLFKVAVALLIIWGLGIAGVYAVGQIVHVLLLVGLMLLLLSVAKAHEAATRVQRPGFEQVKPLTGKGPTCLQLPRCLVRKESADCPTSETGEQWPPDQNVRASLG